MKSSPETAEPGAGDRGPRIESRWDETLLLLEVEVEDEREPEGRRRSFSLDLEADDLLLGFVTETSSTSSLPWTDLRVGGRVEVGVGVGGACIGELE